jgi:hypothetical protein
MCIRDLGGRIIARVWHRLSRAARHALEAEVAPLPLPGIKRGIVTRWVD